MHFILRHFSRKSTDVMYALSTHTEDIKLSSIQNVVIIVAIHNVSSSSSSGNRGSMQSNYII